MFKKIIVGKKITLKTLEPKYFEDYHAMFSSTVRKALGLPQVATIKETKNFLKTKLRNLEGKEPIFYCIFDNADQKLIGGIEIRDPDYKEGQLGAWINESYWGEGRYQESLNLLLKSYFKTTNAKSVSAHINAENTRSLKAHQKFGFRIIREFNKNNKKHFEVGILREEVVK